MRAVAEPHRRRGTADLLDREDVLQITEPEPAIRLADRDAVQAERAHVGPQVAREPVLRVDLHRQRGDPVRREASRSVTNHLRVLAQREVEVRGHALSNLVLDAS